MKPYRETRQKSIIREELKKFDSFFTADGLYWKIKIRDDRIGVATIYRFLNDMKKRGELHTYTCNRKSLYSKNLSSHCHFTCQSCGRISHIEVNQLDFLSKKIKGKICHFQIDVSGVCEECAGS